MADLPPAMKTEGRKIDNQFHSQELLYRRVPLDLWDDPSEVIEIDAIELPDMSVVRSKYAHPEWARFEGDEYKFRDWGVIAFSVADIPDRLTHLGVFDFTFRAEHAPLKKNYPHSEVRAYESDQHIKDDRLLDYELHLRWREQLVRKVQKVLLPHEDVHVRQSPPS